MILSEKLKRYRTNSGFSQKKVAELVGVSRQAVSKWEGGQSMPSSEKLIALASIYGTMIPLLACSVWMTCNLKYEKNMVQYRKNVKIELLYCLLQLEVALLAFYSDMLFLGALILIAVASIYIFVINPNVVVY